MRRQARVAIAVAACPVELRIDQRRERDTGGAFLRLRHDAVAQMRVSVCHSHRVKKCGSRGDAQDARR